MTTAAEEDSGTRRIATLVGVFGYTIMQYRCTKRKSARIKYLIGDIEHLFST